MVHKVEVVIGVASGDHRFKLAEPKSLSQMAMASSGMECALE